MRCGKDLQNMTTETSPASAPVPIGKELVTVLSCKRGQATKVFTPQEVRGYQIGKFFDVTEHPANNIHDLFALLEDLAGDTKRLIIRGRPAVPQRENVVRRCRGEDATFADKPIHWVCVDLDGVGTISPDASPQVEIQTVLDSSPLLRDVTCVAQLSSSWGVKPGIRAHLWYWLEEPRTSSQVAEWAAALPFKTDSSLYNAVQPHYTANPVFDRVADPLGGTPRMFLIKGHEDSLYIPSGAAEVELAHWVDKIINVEEDAPRHTLINAAAYSLGGWVGAGVMGAEETIDILAQACEESGAFDAERVAAARDEITRAVADGQRKPRQHDDWRSAMIRNKEGKIKPLPENYIRIFKQHQALAGVLGFDLRTSQPMILKRPPWETSEKVSYPRELRDNDDTEATAWVNRIGVHTSAVSLISQAVTAAAQENPFDRIVEWLEGLPAWDRTERLYTWLPEVTGCENTVFHRGAGAKFLIALVARACDPGCKADEMVILTGPQGTYKSTLLRELVSGPGEWAFSDCLGDIRKPADYMPTLMGPWLIEVGELHGFTKREVEAIKKFLSTQTDRFRLSYGRRAVSIPRRGCIAGTSNTTAFLTDITGNRRFWPIDVNTIDLDLLRSQRDQLFAEALYQYKQGLQWHLTAEESTGAVEEQEKHRASDPWEYQIREYLDSSSGVDDLESMLDGIKDQVTVNDILVDALRVPSGQANPSHVKRVAGILKRYGWTRTREYRNGQRHWVYRRGVK